MKSTSPQPVARSAEQHTQPVRRLSMRHIVTLFAALAVLALGVPVVAHADPTEYTSPADPSVRYTVPAQVAVGEDIVVSGAGWINTEGTAGSVISVFFNAAFSGDPNTVYTKRDVIDPISGQVFGDKRSQGLVQADAQGNWTLTIPFPTAQNAQLADGSWPGWNPGSSHQIRFLTGSLLPGDQARSLAAEFTIIDPNAEPEPEPTTEPTDPTPGPTDPTPEPTTPEPTTPEPTEPAEPTGPNEPPAWDHVAVQDVSGALAWIERDVSIQPGSTIRIKGSGWQNTSDGTGSTVAIKLNYGTGQQYVRTGSGIVQHPSASGDDTIWVLLAPGNAAGHENVFPIDSDGNFEIEFDAPPGLTPGQYFNVLFQSGRFVEGDVLRSVTSGHLAIGGVPYTDGGTGGGGGATCVPTSNQASINIENPNVSLGGTLHITGEGWCHPEEGQGGSTIALKIDEGEYSHLDSALHQNRTIWAIFEANAADGTFDVEIDLPDGTESGSRGSTPAFTEGAHTLRLLTGSLKPNDAIRTLRSDEFVVGAYAPSGPPDPVEASERLTDATRGPVVVRQTADSVIVTVRGGAEGDWVYLNLFEENTPRFPWGAQWFQLDGNSQVTASLQGVRMMPGTHKLSVQSGNQGESGTLLGWGTIFGPAETPAAPNPSPGVTNPTDGTAGNTTTGGSQSSGGGSTTTSNLVATAAQTTTAAASAAAAGTAAASTGPPTTTPEAPVERASQLTPEMVNDTIGQIDGTVVTLELPNAEPGQWVFAYVYTGATITPVGWVQLDDNRTVTLDLEALGEGRHRVALVNEAAEVLGWASFTIGEEDEPVAELPSTTSVADPVLTPAANTDFTTTELALYGAAGLVLLLAAGGAGFAIARRS